MTTVTDTLPPTTEVATRAGARADALTLKKAAAVSRTAVTAVSEATGTPDVWNDDRPSLRRLWYYTRDAAWAAKESPARIPAGLYAGLIVFPLTTALYLFLWTIARPGRAGVAAAIGGLLYLAFKL